MPCTIIDLSVAIQHNSPSEPRPPVIRTQTHRESAEAKAKSYGISPDQFPDGVHLVIEEVSLSTHAGTHVDAPWHYGPESEGRPARTIERLPLEWFFGPGVVLDVSHRRAGDEVTEEDLRAAVERIRYEIKPLDIVLIQTGADAWAGKEGYIDAGPGLTREAVFWLLDRGVQVIGIDGFSLDKSPSAMAREFKTKGVSALSPAHYAGREREYCQIEKLCNLDRIPRPYGFTVAAFPVKIEGTGGAWTRAVAIVD